MARRSRYTKEFITKRLDAWYDAELALSTSQSYAFEGRNLTRASLSDVRKQIAFWENELEMLETGRTSRNRVQQVIFH